MSINFPKSPNTNDTYTYLTTTWKYNGTAWEKSAATETGNTEGNTGEVAFYSGKGSTIAGATAFFYDGDKVGIGTSGPTETLDVRGGITASGNIFTAQGLTADTLKVESELILGGNIILPDEGHIGGGDGQDRIVFDINGNHIDVNTNIVRINSKLEHLGDDNTHLDFDTDDIKLTAGGNEFIHGTSTTANIGGVTFAGGGATFSTFIGLTSEGQLMFADGSTQASSAIDHFSLNSGGNPFYSGQVVSAEKYIFKGIDLSTSEATDISIALQSATVPDVPNQTAKYVFSLGNNVPRKDASNTFTHTSGNIFNTPIGTNKLTPGNAAQVLIAALDLSSSTYIGLTGGVINHKILGSEVVKATSDRVEFAHGISAAGATLCNSSSEIIHCYDGELNRPKLKDFSETVNAIGTVNSNTEVNFENGNVQTVTVGGNCEFSFGDPPSSGQAGTVTLIITNGGGHTTTWHSSVKWPSGVAPSLTTSGSNPDIITFLTTDAGTTVYGFVGGLNFS